MGRHLLAAAASLLLAGWEPAAGETLVPANVQATVTVRILEYDRSLKTWAASDLTVGLVARKTSAGHVADFQKQISGRAAQDLPLKILEHAYRDGETLRAWIQSKKIRMLYVAEDLGPETGAVLGSEAARKLPTLVPTRAQFESGAALGIVVKDGRPHIMVNLGAARTAGMDLDAKLLQLAEVVR